MNRILLIAISTVIAIFAWATVIFLGTSGGWWKSPVADTADSIAFTEYARKKVDTEHQGNLVFILLEKGEVSDKFALSPGKPVDENSVFQVASLGKWLTAWGVMALVEDGRVELDAPVSQYLTRWQLPDSEFNHDGVTVARLLSHTAGLDDGLGYDGFDTREEVQTLEESLARAGDASPGKTGKVKVGIEPGSEWKYSGGGYTVLQLLIEEVSGLSFAEYMKQCVFEPLGLTRTTFDHEKAIELGLVENFTLSGKTEAFRWYTALGATSLFTTPADMAKFVAIQAPGSKQSVLSDDTLAEMAQSQATSMGADVWGLGTMLYAPNNEGGFIIGHDGNNEPAINTAVRFNPVTGDGIVVLETGSALLATEIASEWVFWKTGNVDNLAFVIALDGMLVWILIGSALILLAGLVLSWRQWRRGRG